MSLLPWNMPLLKHKQNCWASWLRDQIYFGGETEGNNNGGGWIRDGLTKKEINVKIITLYPLNSPVTTSHSGYEAEWNDTPFCIRTFNTDRWGGSGGSLIWMSGVQAPALPGCHCRALVVDPKKQGYVKKRNFLCYDEHVTNNGFFFF